MMDAAFGSRVRRLPKLLDKLLCMQATPLSNLPELPACGVYLMSVGARHLYVGQTSRDGASMRARILEHTRPYQSDFAWRCAADLLKLPVASAHHVSEKLASTMRSHLLRALRVRYIEVVDPIQRCLLELYVHSVLKTRYNCFGVHRKFDMDLFQRSCRRMDREGRLARNSSSSRAGSRA